MYALINTMGSADNVTVGRILSRHHTIEAAEREESKLQRMTKRANGQNSYLPLLVAELDGPAKTGAFVSRSELVEQDGGTLWPR